MSEQKPATYQDCPRCGHRNRVGVLICESCGTSLNPGTVIVSGTRQLSDEDSQRLQAMQEARLGLGSGDFEPAFSLVLHVPNNNQPISIRPADFPAVVFGRQDPSAGIFPQVDLTLYAAFQLGLSRRHAQIVYRERKLFLQDLKSANGTYLNGVKLTPMEEQQIRNGDEIKMGQLSMQVVFKPA